MFLIFFFATPVWFPRKSIPHLISGKIHSRLISEKIHAKPPRKTKKIPFFLAACVFWICSRGLFAFMPLDLNFTNPKSTSFDFRENPCKTPKENQKNCFFFAPYVFWICSRGLFAFVPLDLIFTNPKSTIFEPGWKTQPLPANPRFKSYI